MIGKGRGSVVSHCEACGSELRRPPAQKTRRHCSAECARKTAMATGTCRTCGCEFEFKASQRNHFKNAGTFCSQACVRSMPGKCVVCQSSFVGKIGQRFCSAHAGKGYLLLGPVARRAWSMCSAVIGGPGKRARMVELLGSAVGRPCPYCSVEITVENAGLDHKVAVGAGGNARREMPRHVREHNDRPENLQIICRKCNGLKGTFSDEEYRQVLDFIAANPALGEKLMVRLRTAALVFCSQQRDLRARAA